MTLSDRVVVMRAGRIEQVGTPEDLYERPQNQFVADFIGASNSLEGELKTEGERLVFVAGEGLRLPVTPPPGRTTQGRVRLIIRPERIRWAEDESTEVTTAGVVVSSTYLGERVRYLVRLQGGQTLVAPTLTSLPGQPKEGPLYGRVEPCHAFSRKGCSASPGEPGPEGWYAVEARILSVLPLSRSWLTSWFSDPSNPRRSFRTEPRSRTAGP
jgi:ABC-type sugar transport system ATPase subunit